MRKQRQVCHLLRVSASFVILLGKMSHTEESNYCYPQTVIHHELDSPINDEILAITIKVKVLFSFTFRFWAFIGQIVLVFYVTMKTKTFLSSLDSRNWSYNKTRRRFETHAGNIMLYSCVDWLKSQNYLNKCKYWCINLVAEGGPGFLHNCRFRWGHLKQIK